MTASDSPHDAGDELAAQRRRVEVCVRFEKAWRARATPRDRNRLSRGSGIRTAGFAARIAGRGDRVAPGRW